MNVLNDVGNHRILPGVRRTHLGGRCGPDISGAVMPRLPSALADISPRMAGRGGFSRKAAPILGLSRPMAANKGVRARQAG